MTGIASAVTSVNTDRGIFAVLLKITGRRNSTGHADLAAATGVRFDTVLYTIQHNGTCAAVADIAARGPACEDA